MLMENVQSLQQIAFTPQRCKSCDSSLHILLNNKNLFIHAFPNVKQQQITYSSHFSGRADMRRWRDGRDVFEKQSFFHRRHGQLRLHSTVKSKNKLM